MKKWLILWVLVFCLAPFVNAQSASTSHVFPQIADGRQADGAYYTSLIWITNLSGESATCTISISGFPTTRLTSSPVVTLPNGSWAMVSTRGQDPIATGYARLDCSQPVGASLTFVLLAPTGTTVVGMATVLSAPASSYAMLPMRLNDSSRYGFAIANDNDLPLAVTLLFNASSGQTGNQTIQIAPRSQYVRFVDEVFSVPLQGAGTFEVLANGASGSGSFNVMGLLFDGRVFTTLLPATP